MLGSDMPSFGGSEHVLHPMPQDSAWKEEEYREWIQWLVQHPEQLRPLERNERKMKIGEVNVTFVHGDIQITLTGLNQSMRVWYLEGNC